MRSIDLSCLCHFFINLNTNRNKINGAKENQKYWIFKYFQKHSNSVLYWSYLC